MAYKIGDITKHPDGRTATLTESGWVVSKVKPQATPKDFSFSEMVSNIPSSAVQFGSDIIQPILSPIDTAQNLGKLITGGASNIAKYAREQGLPLTPEPSPEQLAAHGGYYPYEQEADAAGEALKARYGSVPALKQTLMADPVGSLADVATLATGGGTLMAKMPSLMGKTGQVIQKTGMALEPLNMMKGIAKTGIGALTPKSLPANLYKSAAKFPTTLDAKYGMGTRTKLAETALKHKLMPNEQGILNLSKYETELGKRIGGLIDAAGDSGVPKSKVFRLLKDARKEVGGARVNAAKNTKQIDVLAKDLNQQLRKIKGDKLSVRDLQDLKVSAQKAANYDVGTVRETGTELGNKAIARAAKEEIEGLIPDARGINEDLAGLKQLKKPLQQAASRIENRDLISIGTPIKTMAGGELAGGRGAIAGFLAGMAEAKKAEMAMGIKAMQDAGLGNLVDQNLTRTLIKQGLLQAGRLEPENE